MTTRTLTNGKWDLPNTEAARGVQFAPAMLEDSAMDAILSMDPECNCRVPCESCKLAVRAELQRSRD